MALEIARTDLTAANTAMEVVRIKAKIDGTIVQDCDLYVGRACYRKPWRQPASEFANPFSAKQYGREGSTVRYEQYVRDNSELWSKLDLITTMAVQRYHIGLSMRLGCWCAPQACHADVIIRLIKEKHEVD